MTSQPLPRFHAEALLITATFDRSEPRDAIRQCGADIYADHKTTAALSELMQLCCEYRPELQNQLLGDFNGALNGIGTWSA